nr:uncharacterized protein LOC107127711 isoform X2 [Macaca fascicularis]
MQREGSAARAPWATQTPLHTRPRSCLPGPLNAQPPLPAGRAKAKPRGGPRGSRRQHSPHRTRRFHRGAAANRATSSPHPQLQVCACAGRSLGLHLPEASAPTASARALRPRRVGAAKRLGAGEPVPVLERSGKERAACTTGMARPDALEDPGNCSPCSDEKNQDSETIKVTEMKLTEPGFRIFFLDSFVGLRTGHPVYSAHCAQPLAGVCRCWQ